MSHVTARVTTEELAALDQICAERKQDRQEVLGEAIRNLLKQRKAVTTATATKGKE